MEFLRFLEGLRTPAGDAFFSAVTHFGEETLFILIGLIFFWCINKKEGYYLLFIGFIGTILNQFLKLVFRIPRPWKIDTNFTPVKSAVEGATGYSFPSGHTQSSVGIFGGIARWNKKIWLRTVSISIAVLVPISRMYLGVHTPLDVGVSVISAIFLIFGLYPILHKSTDNTKSLRAIIVFIVLFSLAYLLFVNFHNFPADIDSENYKNGLKNGYKIFGCSLGILLTFEIDTRFIHFETRAALPAQILKLLFGFIPIILIKSLLKEPLALILGNSFVADCVRYFLLTAFAGCVWPLTFKRFSKLFIKKSS